MTAQPLAISVFAAALTPFLYGSNAPSILLSPANVDLRAGQSRTVTVTATGGASTQNLVWSLQSSASTYTGSLGAFDPVKGVYTAPATPPSPNTIKIVATDSTNSALTAFATVNVLNPAPTISGLEPSTINAGLAYSVLIKGTGFMAGSQVSWDGKSAPSTWDAATGYLRISGGVAPAAGKSQIVVTNPDPGARASNSATLNVTQVQVQVSPDGRTLRTGGSLALSSKVVNSTDQTVVWSVKGGAAYGTVDEKAVYHAPSVLPPSTIVTVTAVSKADPTASASLAINLLNVVPVLTALDPSSINTELPFSVTLKGSGIVAGAQVQWGNVVIESTFDPQTGFLTIAGKGPAPGSLQLTVTNPQSGGTPSNARTLNVLPPVAVQLSPDGRTIRCNATLQLSPKVQNNTDQTVTWTVTGGGSVNAKNVYTAPPVLPSPADVTITAKANADPKAVASITIHLLNPTPAVTSASPSSLSVGDSGFSITGLGFAKNATVYFAGAKMPTQWVSDTELTVTGAIPALPGGIAAVKVMNPDPGSSVSTSIVVPVKMTGNKMSYAEAVRFLELASWGPTPESVAHLMTVGRDAWLAEQFDPAATTITPYPLPNDANEGVTRMQDAFFTNALTGPDQLRQRVAFALSQILVVSAIKDTRYAQMAPYMTMLSTNAFGNFRTLMEQVTRNPSMGYFLDMVNNDKANPARNTVANENYARELMQLFTVGLVNLNMDASAAATPTYDETTVKELAKVMTGWTYAPQTGFASHWTNPAWYFDPMIAFEEHHDVTAKTLKFTGYSNPSCSIAGGGKAQSDLTSALDCIFNHPNVAPFISYRLIQRLVTSNPSPAYVRDISTVFRNTNGDLKQVVTAILTHAEAGAPLKLNEPVLFATRLLRSLNATVTNQATGIRSQTTAMGQNVLTAPSVFNYFSPFFRVGGTVAPEFQIVNAATALGRLNFANRVVYNQLSGAVRVDFTNWQDLAANPATLIEAVNQALYRGEMTADEKSALSVAVGSNKSAANIVRAVVYVAASSPRYQVQQ